MKAFMSDRERRDAELNGTGGIRGASHITRWTHSERNQIARLEAKRILADTEPDAYHCTIHLCGVSTLPAEERCVLAADIADALPLLDELAHAATYEAFHAAPDKAGRMAVSFMFERNYRAEPRNRATDAALDGR